jgi:uncharacterized glyoxalase superfamily protein PhnB
VAEDRVRLDQINVVVPEMEAAVAFYRLLGCEIEESGDEWDAHHRRVKADSETDFDLDSTAFASSWDRGWPGGSGVVVTFRTEEREAVDRIYERMIGAGYEGEQPPYDAFWGARFAVLKDPGGNGIGIMSPAEEAHRHPPVLPNND